MENDRIDSFRGEYEFLSNFYPVDVCFEGIVYRNAEAAFQAQKCTDPELRSSFAELTGGQAKRKGRRVPLRPDWETVKVDIMRRVVYAKFTRNPSLAQALLATGDRMLIEGNTWHDVFWGVDSRTGRGQNHLGRILTELRALLREQGLPAPESPGA
jgi:ribA/ribD-fused uncharacterized protein